MENTVAQHLYNEHIKEALLSGKRIEMSMKDFLPKKETNKRTKEHKRKDEIQVTIEELTSHIQNMYNVFDDHQKEMASQGKLKEATKAWSDKQTYEILLCKIYKKEYVCKIPSYTIWI